MNEAQQALSSLIILMDSREKKTSRRDERLASFESLGVSVIQRRLNFGDYSAYYTNPATGETVDLGRRIIVERKFGIDELVQCLTWERSRFFAELQRAKDMGVHMIIAVESGSIDDLMHRRYRSDANPAAVMGSLYAMQTRYGVEIIWLTPELFPRYVYGMYRRMALDDVAGAPHPAGV